MSVQTALMGNTQLGSFCLSEPVSGSDAFALQTRAEKKGDHYVINGSKMYCLLQWFGRSNTDNCACRWITNSWEAEIFLVFATVDASKGYKGITCFVVPREDVKIAKKEQKLGIRASSTCTVAFDDVKVPLENVIGGEGKGYKVQLRIHKLLGSRAARSPLKFSMRVRIARVAVCMLTRVSGRIGIAGQMVGLAQGAFDKAVPYTYERSQFGQPVGTFQGMQFQIAQAAADIAAARLLTYNAARRKEAGQPFVKEAAMAKLVASQVAQRVSGAAIEWCGGVGFTRETGIEKFWRDSKIVRRLGTCTGC